MQFVIQKFFRITITAIQDTCIIFWLIFYGIAVSARPVEIIPVELPPWNRIVPVRQSVFNFGIGDRFDLADIAFTQEIVLQPLCHIRQIILPVRLFSSLARDAGGGYDLWIWIIAYPPLFEIQASAFRILQQCQWRDNPVFRPNTALSS